MISRTDRFTAAGRMYR